MINFRFHLASLIAVFLALAIGIVMGSTVVKEATVKGLRAEIHRVERRSDARQRDNNQLKSQLDDQQTYAREATARMVQGALRGVKVAVVAVRGVNGDTVKSTVQLLQQAGATTPGILWMEPSWTLKNSDDVKKLATLIGEPGATGKQLRDDAFTLLASRLTGPVIPPQPVETAAAPVVSGRDMLAGLSSDGFMTFEGVGSQGGRGFSLAAFPGPSARVLVIDATDAQVDLRAVVPPFARALADARLQAAVANVYHGQQGKPTRGSGVAGIIGDNTLSKQVATVDDLDLPQGQVAVVLALAELDRRVGHYGYGDGSSGIVPPIPQP